MARVTSVVARVTSVVARVTWVMAGSTAVAWLGEPRALDVRMILHDFRSPRADPRDGRVLVTGPHAPWHDRGSHASPSTRHRRLRAKPAVAGRVPERVAIPLSAEARVWDRGAKQKGATTRA